MKVKLTACMMLLAASCSTTPVATIPAPNEAVAAYRLAPGDSLKVGVYGEDNLSGVYAVDSRGFISMPLAGNISVGGLTARQAEDAIAMAYKKGILDNPQISAEVTVYRPVYILGEVAKPGEYPFTPDLTIMEAIAEAGGFTYRGNAKKVYVRHSGESSEHLYRLTAATPVQPGDTVRIVDKIF